MTAERLIDRELSVGEIFGRAFSTYGGHFLGLYLPFLIVAVVEAILAVSVFTLLPIPEIPSVNAPEAALMELFGYLLVLLGVTLLVGLISWILSTVAVGIATKYVVDLTEAGSANSIRALNFAISKLGSLLVAGLVTGILIGLGLVLFVVPGVIIAIMFSVVVPCIIIGKLGAFGSMGESRRLASYRWGKVFLVLLINFLIITIAGYIGGYFGALFGTAEEFISGAITSLASPIGAVATVFLYYSLLAKERQRFPPPPPPPPSALA